MVVSLTPAPYVKNASQHKEFTWGQENQDTTDQEIADVEMVWIG
ncbi:MAG: hypothetical protein VXZ38_10910 [Planctomycetota bacterium]|nr:hypothetical protein [Planctomycetota bacterium]